MKSCPRELQGAVDWTKYDGNLRRVLFRNGGIGVFGNRTADIVISDISMPVMDGISMARKLGGGTAKKKIRYCLFGGIDFHAREALRLGNTQLSTEAHQRIGTGNRFGSPGSIAQDDHQTKEYVHPGAKREINETCAREKFFQWLISETLN